MGVSGDIPQQSGTVRQRFTGPEEAALSSPCRAMPIKALGPGGAAGPEAVAQGRPSRRSDPDE
jgi:hypothetical protein